MPTFDLDVTKITAASGDADDMVSALYTHFNTTSTKFSVKQGAGVAFTLDCELAGEDWEVNVRSDGAATNIKALLDPLGNITDAGDTSTAPTLTDSSESSGEVNLMTLAATRSPDLYVIELPDAFIVLTMNSGKTQLSEGMHVGKIWRSIPFANPVDELGMLGDWLDFSSYSSAHSYWLGASGPSLVYVDAGTWKRPTTPLAANNETYAPSGKRWPGAIMLSIEDISSSFDRAYAGYLRYCYFSPEGTTSSIGDTEDGTNDHFIYAEAGVSTTKFLLPWDGSTADFA